jgi:hypothetical protein
LIGHGWPGQLRDNGVSVAANLFKQSARFGVVRRDAIPQPIAV